MISLNSTGCRDRLCPHLPLLRLKELAKSQAAISAAFVSEQSAPQKELNDNWRAWTKLHERPELQQRSLLLAEQLREGFKTFVHVGIGGSDLGPRVCHEVLDHSLHNELTDADRGGASRIYFTGDTFDPRPLRELLALLQARGDLPATVFNIVCRSGKTPETLCAMLAIRAAVERAKLPWPEHLIATTLEDEDKSVLYGLAKKEGFAGILPVPEGVGGRFSVPSPVGLLPLAVTAGPGETPAGRIEHALVGHAEGHRRMLLPPTDLDNLAFRLAYWLHLAEEQLRLGTLVLYDYSGCRMLGDWLVQLYTESIQERGGGLNIIAARGPTSNHSLLNGIIGGPRDKIVLFIRWADLGEDLPVPEDPDAPEDLRPFTGKKMGVLQKASCDGALTDFTLNGIPCLELVVPRRDTYHLFLLMRILMDMVAVKGRLQGLHLGPDFEPDYPGELTYQQYGVEGSKQAMRDILARP